MKGTSHGLNAAHLDLTIDFTRKLFRFSLILKPYLALAHISASDLSQCMNVHIKTVKLWLRDTGKPVLPKLLHYAMIRHMLARSLATKTFSREDGTSDVLLREDGTLIHNMIAEVFEGKVKESKSEDGRTQIMDMIAKDFRARAARGTDHVSFDMLDATYGASSANSFSCNDVPSAAPPVAIPLEWVHEVIPACRATEQLYVLFTCGELEEPNFVPLQAWYSMLRLYHQGETPDCDTAQAYLPVLYKRDVIFGRSASAIVRHDGVVRLATRLRYEPTLDPTSQPIVLFPVRNLGLSSKVCTVAEAEILYVQHSDAAKMLVSGSGNGFKEDSRQKLRRGARTHVHRPLIDD